MSTDVEKSPFRATVDKRPFCVEPLQEFAVLAGLQPLVGAVPPQQLAAGGFLRERGHAGGVRAAGVSTGGNLDDGALGQAGQVARVL